MEEQMNRNYKDTVFTTLYQEKWRLAELVNALEGTSYTEADIEIKTLSQVLFYGRKNDVACLAGGKFLILSEHQSTLNENLPLRNLLYIARVYEKIIENRSIYKKNRIYLPIPELIVFYNGTEPYPQEKILRLSDAFLEERTDYDVEIRVRVININPDMKHAILERCPTLCEYSQFVETIRRLEREGYERAEAVRAGIEICKKKDILRSFLTEHSTEVSNMLFTEFNMEDALEVQKEEGIEIGMQRGVEKGREQGIEALILDNLEERKTTEQIVKKLVKRFGLTEEQAEQYIKRYV